MNTVFDYDPTLYHDYVYDNSTPLEGEEDAAPPHDAAACFGEAACVALLVADTLIFLLGICGNAVVIWIAGCKMKRTVTTTWYLSLAVSDFVFCAFLPLIIVQVATKDWKLGLAACKLSSFVLFLNMFSSVLLLVAISVDRCVQVACPVWAQNHRTVGKASAAVASAWGLSAALSAPAMYFRDVRTHLGKTVCFNNYSSHEHGHGTVAGIRFVAGFAVPLGVILACYSVIAAKLRRSARVYSSSRSSKPFKVMTALVCVFVACWLPYHVFILLELSPRYQSQLGLTVATTIAAANSFLNPVLYVFMGGDFKRTFKSSVLSKIENAMGGGGPDAGHRSSSIRSRVALSSRTKDSVVSERVIAAHI